MQLTDQEATQLVNLLMRKTVSREVEWNRTLVKDNKTENEGKAEQRFFAHFGTRTLELGNDTLRVWLGAEEEVDIELNGFDDDVELDSLIEAVEECFARPPMKVAEFTNFLTELSSTAH